MCNACFLSVYRQPFVPLEQISLPFSLSPFPCSPSSTSFTTILTETSPFSPKNDTCKVIWLPVFPATLTTPHPQALPNLGPGRGSPLCMESLSDADLKWCGTLPYREGREEGWYWDLLVSRTQNLCLSGLALWLRLPSRCVPPLSIWASSRSHLYVWEGWLFYSTLRSEI